MHHNYHYEVYNNYRRLTIRGVQVIILHPGLDLINVVMIVIIAKVIGNAGGVLCEPNEVIVLLCYGSILVAKELQRQQTYACSNFYLVIEVTCVRVAYSLGSSIQRRLLNPHAFQLAPLHRLFSSRVVVELHHAVALSLFGSAGMQLLLLHVLER